MSDTPLGRFCWFELMTPDPSKAPAFYAEVTGWSTMPYDGGEKPYTMWVNGEGPIGGLMELPQEAIDNGAPPHWMPYVSTPDVAATSRKAEELGATVLGRSDVPSVGSFAVIRDPQGAVICAYQPSDFTPGHDDMPKVGEFSWMELATDGWEDAWAFYSELFGWEQTDQVDMGEIGIYHMFGRGAHPVGGIFNRPPEIPIPCWWLYVRVPDVAAAVEKVKANGGQLILGPMEVPGGDIVAQCVDPQGAAFALHATAIG